MGIRREYEEYMKTIDEINRDKNLSVDNIFTVLLYKCPELDTATALRLLSYWQSDWYTPSQDLA